MINARYVDGLELRIKELSKKLSDESNSALHLIAENKFLKAERDTLLKEKLPDGYIAVPAAAWHELVQVELERDTLAAQVKQLKSELRQEKLIHIGFTNESQVQYVTEDKEEGAFYPNSDHGCYIPVYMLNVHAHRVGPDSKIYCTQLEQGKNIAELRAEAVTDAADKMGDAFILPASLRRETQKAEFYKAGWRDAFLFLKQYADQIRWEVK